MSSQTPALLVVISPPEYERNSTWQKHFFSNLYDVWGKWNWSQVCTETSHDDWMGPSSVPSMMEPYSAVKPWLETDASVLKRMYIDLCVDSTIGGIWSPQYLPMRGELEEGPSLTYGENKKVLYSFSICHILTFNFAMETKHCFTQDTIKITLRNVNDILSSESKL